MTFITPDYPDWSTPGREVASDFDITPAAGVLGTGSSYVGMDVSQAKSVLVSFTPPTGAGGDRFLMRATWGGLFSAGMTEYLFFHDRPAYAPDQRVITWVLPCKGTSLSITITSANANTFPCGVVATTRQLPSNTVQLQGQVSNNFNSGIGRYIANLASVVLAAGATSSPIFVPPVTSQILLHCNFRLSVFSMTINALDLSLLTVGADRLCSIPGDSLANGQVPIRIPQTGLEIVVTNGDTVAHSTNLKVWDVS